VSQRGIGSPRSKNFLASINADKDTGSKYLVVKTPPHRSIAAIDNSLDTH
jgi:hypothetical protein